MKKRMPILISIIWIVLIVVVIGLIEYGKMPFGLKLEDQAYVSMGLGILIPGYFCMLFSNARHKPRVIFVIFAFLYALGAIVGAGFSLILLLGEAMGNGGDYGPIMFAVCVSCIYGFAFVFLGTKSHGIFVDIFSMILPIVSIALFSYFGENIIFKIVAAVIAGIMLLVFIPATKESSGSSISSSSSRGMSPYDLARELRNTTHLSVDVVSTSGATAVIKVSSLGYDWITQSDLDKAINFVRSNGCTKDVQLKYHLK